MSEIDWMYDSLTERFGGTLGERQKVVDALLIAKALVGPGPLGGTNSGSLLSVARFILDEWGKYSDAGDAEEDDGPLVIEVNKITEPDIRLMEYGTHTFPEGSRWVNSYGTALIFTEGEFLLEGSRFKAKTDSAALPFYLIDKGEN